MKWRWNAWSTYRALEQTPATGCKDHKRARQKEGLHSFFRDDLERTQILLGYQVQPFTRKPPNQPIQPAKLSTAAKMLLILAAKK